MPRIGFGFDVHELKEGYPLWIGGVLIDSDKGAIGHSDADVLIHAICDALLGALALKDIGYHFPDTSTEFKGIQSTILLSKVISLINNKGYKIINVDSTVCLKAPKISKYIDNMKKILSEIMSIEKDCISIKATTTEKLGYIGERKGICAYANVLLEKKDA